MIALGGIPAALAAKAATTTIPVLFQIGADPVAAGLVDSLSRPGGNLTGSTNLSIELGPKRLQLLHELVPAARIVALLLDPTSGSVSEIETKSMQSAAQSLGLALHVVHASAERDFDAVFSTLDQIKARRPRDCQHRSIQCPRRRARRAGLAPRDPGDLPIARLRHRPAASISYGTSIPDGFRLIGVYAGRILKGENAGELPVQEPRRNSR